MGTGGHHHGRGICGDKRSSDIGTCTVCVGVVAVGGAFVRVQLDAAKIKRSQKGNDSVGGNFLVPHQTTETHLHIWVRYSWKFWIDDREFAAPSRASGFGQSARACRSAHKHIFSWTLGSGNCFFRRTSSIQEFRFFMSHNAARNMEILYDMFYGLSEHSCCIFP